MGILLKDQYNQMRQITSHTRIDESVTYHPPRVDVLKKSAGGNDPTTYKAAQTLFYDFYAMETLHRWFGKNPYADDLNPIAKSKLAAARGVSWYDPTEQDQVVFPNSGIILNHRYVELIDDVFDQVTNAISKKVMAHLRLGLVQELRHLMNHSGKWSNFRHSLITIANVYGKLTNADLNNAIKKYLPAMVNEKDSVIRLLKFAKYYSPMTTDKNEDPIDLVKDDPTPEEAGWDLSADEPDVVREPEPDDPDFPTDELPEPEFSDDEEHPTTLTKRDPTGYTHHNNYWNSTKDDKEKDDKLNEVLGVYENNKLTMIEESYASGRMSPSTIRKVNSAINKSGLTWQDIDNAYNKIQWSGGYGGPKWGTGSTAFIKLMPKQKTANTEEVAYAVDHIFDLVHNGGALLNKGGMYIDDTDLDRRAKTTHIARYLPFVSPQIKKIINTFVRYFPGDPEIEKNVDEYLKNPAISFTAEQGKILEDMGFVKETVGKVGESYKARIKFFSKKLDGDGNPIPVSGRYYVVIPHMNGKITINDDLMADVQVLNTFQEALDYIEKFKRDIKPPIKPPGFFAPSLIGTIGQTTSPQSFGVDTIKLGKEQEIQLVGIQMGWRPKTRVYKAYFKGAKRFILMAHKSGIFTCYFNGKSSNTFDTWTAAFQFAKNATVGAEPISAKDPIGTAALIGTSSTLANMSNIGKVAPKASVTPSAYVPAPLPAVSVSKASYNIHAGINVPPSSTIRLTIEDEKILMAIGFTPRMILNAIWYIHSGTNDVVKFYPNNTGKITFVVKGQGNPGFTLPIDKMLEWLTSKYTISTKISPLTAVTAPSKPAKTGIRLSGMFEKRLTEAGYEWNPTLMRYIQKSSNNKLLINPNRSSVLTLGVGVDDDQQVFFDNLPQLFNYLTNVINYLTNVINHIPAG